MKILYGVQTTGNGHTSRSIEVIQELKDLGHDVHVILSGNNPYRFAGLEVLNPQPFSGVLLFIPSGEESNI